MSGPYAVVLRFRGPAVAPTPAQLHAAFLDLVRRGDPALATELHNPRLGLRPYALSVLGNPSTRFLGLRVSVLDPELFRRFWDKWNGRGGFPLVLDRRRCLPSAAEEEGPWAGRWDWEALGKDRAQGPLQMVFCTPTTFRQGDLDLPLPVPRLVFGGLLEKWTRFAPYPLPLDLESLERQVALSAGRVRIRPFRDGRDEIRGFVGSAEFHIARSASAEERRAVAALADFAFFAGVGRKTTHGMGLVRLRP